MESCWDDWEISREDWDRAESCWERDWIWGSFWRGTRRVGGGVMAGIGGRAGGAARAAVDNTPRARNRYWESDPVVGGRDLAISFCLSFSPVPVECFVSCRLSLCKE